MQNALADLRKNQPQAAGGEETQGGYGSGPPQTGSGYAHAPATTAYETAGDQTVGQGESAAREEAGTAGGTAALSKTSPAEGEWLRTADRTKAAEEAGDDNTAD